MAQSNRELEQRKQHAKQAEAEEDQRIVEYIRAKDAREQVLEGRVGRLGCQARAEGVPIGCSQRSASWGRLDLVHKGCRSAAANALPVGGAWTLPTLFAPWPKQPKWSSSCQAHLPASQMLACPWHRWPPLWQELAEDRERMAKAKELEVARLRAMQEKIQDTRSAQDEERAKRYQVGRLRA